VLREAVAADSYYREKGLNIVDRGVDLVSRGETL
jgi:hypothetical protein